MIRIRKDIQIAWNLLNIIEKQPEKTLYYIARLEQEQHIRMRESSFRLIIASLAREELLNSRAGLSIWQANKRFISFYNVCEALDWFPEKAAGFCEDVQKKILRVMGETYVHYK